ncbi:MAG: FHA domain-containing protein [Planctomycetota bacterium]
MPIKIEFIEGPVVPATLSLTLSEGESIRVGRKNVCDFAVFDPSISSQHFSIQLSQQQATVTDLGSRNGTSLNGNKIDSATLNDGDRIEAGKSTFQIHLLPVESDSKQKPIVFDSISAEGPAVPAHFASSLWEDSVYEQAGPVEKAGPVIETKRHQPSSPDDPASLDRPNQSKFNSATKSDTVNDRASEQVTIPSAKMRPEATTELVSDNPKSAAPVSNESDSAGPPASPGTSSEPVTPQRQIRWAILEYRNANSEPDEIRLRVGQTVIVGSSSSADITLKDLGLLPQHFLVSCRRDEVVIESLNRKSLVAVNGIQNKQQPVYHDDRVTAGQVTFHVEVDGGQSRERVSDDALGDASILGTGVAADRSSNQRVESNSKRQQSTVLEPIAESEDWPSGVAGRVGLSKEYAAGTLLNQLAKTHTIGLLIDPVRFGQPNHVELNQHMIDRDETGTVKTCLVDVTDKSVCNDWAEQVWGTDCAVFLASPLAFDDLKRELIQFDPEQRVYSVCWPSILRTLFAVFDQSAVNEFFSWNAFVLVEAESPPHWNLYCKPSQLGALERFGLEIPIAESELQPTPSV